ncbi:MAG: HEAT repeat domain-containing protein [Candidatus Omnitrophota bacterium]
MLKKRLLVTIVIMMFASGTFVCAEEIGVRVNYRMKRIAEQLYDRQERVGAQRKLSSYGTEVTEYVLPILKEKGKDHARVAALRIIASVKDERAEDDVAILLKDPNHMVRQEAAKTLGIIGKKDSSVDALRKLLGDFYPNVRFNAIRAMASMARAKDTDVFISALGDYDPRIRKFAVVALGELRSKEAVPYLSQMVRDMDPEVRLELARAFGNIATADCLEPLVWLVSDPSPEIRGLAVEEIGTIKEGDREAALVSITESIYPDVIAKGIRGLTDIKSGKVLEIAKANLNSEHMIVKMAAIYAIGKMGKGENKAVLTDMLEAESTAVRKQAQEALADLKG